MDQIAAGEVVERPASAVRELLDNAIDADARRVVVEIEDGGRKSIRVVDDGSGMGADDAQLAIRRHATSKISSLADLERVRSLGFRGEALPSIASVSRFRLTTRRSDDLAGTRIAIDGGGAPHVRATGAPPGTAVEVRDLFYNVPARRKFLKARQTETGHVHDACLRAALARPELAVRFVSNGRARLDVPGSQGLLERAQQALKTQSLNELSAERSGIRVRACLAPPEEARTGARQLYLFVNGRSVRDRRLAAAVSFAYGSVMPPGRYPRGVVHLELDPTEVDVNVHPQKTEVRFAGGKGVLDELTRALAKGLGTQAWGRSPSPRAPDFWRDRLAGALAAQGAKPAPAHSASAPSIPAQPGASRPATGLAAPAPPALREASASGWSSALASAPSTGTSNGTAAPPPGPDPDLLGARGFFGSLRLLGQAQRLYLVCEGADGLYVLDQHAADERVRYHGLKRMQAEQRVKSQRLLFPERVEVASQEAALIDEHGEELAALGLEVNLLGDTTAAVHTVPTLVARAPAERLLRDVLDELSREGGRAFGDAVDTALATMACHGAIRGGDPLSPEEGRALLRSLDEIDEFAGHCPHGRPVIHRLGFRELGHRLGR